MLLGITGTDGAGKGTVVDYLVKKKDFKHYYNRDVWEEIFKERGMESNRVNMRLVANEMRAEHGNDFLVTYFLKKIKTDEPKHAIIDSIRATAEAETLKINGGILLAVDAEQKLRYERTQSRKSSSDNISFEEFIAHEKIEMDDPDPNGMQKAKVIEMADHTVLNNGTLEELHRQIDDILEKIRR